MEQVVYAGEQVSEYSTTIALVVNGESVEVATGTQIPDSGDAWITYDRTQVVPHAPHTKSGRETQFAVDAYNALPSSIRNHIEALYEYWRTIGELYDAGTDDEWNNSTTLDAMDAVPYPTYQPAA